MHRASGLLAAAVLVVSGCGGSGGPPAWSDEAQLSEPVDGLTVGIDLGHEEYRAGAPIQVKVTLKNTLPKPRFLDLTDGWGPMKIVVTGPDGSLIEPEVAEVNAERLFLKFASGQQESNTYSGPKAAGWKYAPFKEPGEYRIKAVYEVELSDEWNRLSVAGQIYEGQALWTGKAESPEMTFTILEDPRKKRSKKTAE